jgi:hypothetical protein
VTGKRQAGGGASAEAPPLKLRAHDAEDLGALAACLQDALVPLTDVVYLKAEKRFVMVANRFMWERGALEAPTPEPVGAGAAASAEQSAEGGADARFEEAEPGPLFYRVNCAVYFDWVRNVRFRDLEPHQRDQILSLLTVKAEPGAILLVFAGGGAIRLDVRDIRCHLEDLGEPWPTRWRPRHAELEAH